MIKPALRLARAQPPGVSCQIAPCNSNLGIHFQKSRRARARLSAMFSVASQFIHPAVAPAAHPRTLPGAVVEARKGHGGCWTSFMVSALFILPHRAPGGDGLVASVPSSCLGRHRGLARLGPFAHWLLGQSLSIVVRLKI